MVGIYLSGTGNTKYCIEKLVSLIHSSAKAIPMESPEAISAIQQNEEIYIGYPTQFSNAPYMVRDFIKKNADIWKNKKILCIATMGAFSGDGAGCTTRMLKRYGATILGGIHIHMCFNFHHLKVDYKDGNKWELMEPDYMELKVIFEKWQMGMQRGNAWNALFWCNHDQPRIVSRFGNEGEYWKESAKMLAGMIHLMRGTPYIYQGEEIGMTNPHYTSIEQYADVESRNYYEILLNEGKTKEEALEILAARSRDNSRTPMQWTDERYCGFSDTKPWIPVSDNFEKINVKKQKQDRDSILEFYKKLIMLRKEKEVIARGNIEFMEVENAGVLAYTRCLDKQKLLVCCNFRDVESQMEFTQEWKSGRKILGNYEENHKNNYKVLTLRPYEIIVLEKGEE